MREAVDLVNKFKIEKVIFNCGEINELEQDLIKVLDKEKISYYLCIKELNIDDRYNYIDLLFYNIKYKCYVVVVLKITELKKEHTG